MTKLKKQKQFTANEFGKVIAADRWGHFKHNNYRIKMKTRLFRFEKKIPSGYVRLASVNYKDATESNIQQFIKHIFTQRKSNDK